MKHISLILAAFLLIGCHKESTRQTEQRIVNLNEPFTMKAGETVSVQGEPLRFQFNSVLSDSRCPEGARCIWAGNAAVLLSFPDESDTVNTSLDPKEIIHGNYTVGLQLLTPYPKVHQVIIPQDLYRAQFIVNK